MQNDSRFLCSPCLCSPATYISVLVVNYICTYFTSQPSLSSFIHLLFLTFDYHQSKCPTVSVSSFISYFYALLLLFTWSMDVYLLCQVKMPGCSTEIVMLCPNSWHFWQNTHFPQFQGIITVFRTSQLTLWSEIAAQGRAGCKGPECAKEKIKITKGELRVGSWIESSNFQSWSWRHW